MSDGAGGPAAGCFHCGEPLPASPPLVEVDGAPRAVCCEGCGAAARWIREAGLGDYYRLREGGADGAGARVAPDADFSAWDRADVQAGHVVACEDGSQSLTFLLEGMRCAACAWLVDRAARQLPGVLDAGANAVTGRVQLRWDPAATPLSAVLARLHGLGYRPHLAPGEALERERQRERRTLVLRLGVAGLGALQAMMFAEALYLDVNNEMPAATRDFFRWITFLVSAPVVFYAGWPFLQGMARELRARAPGMDVLVGGSILLAYLASLVETLRGGPHVWYDAAVMFVLLLLAARAIEQFARRRAQQQVDALARAQPALARLVAADGTRAEVPVAALAAGDLVEVAVGASVPADGVLEAEPGAAAADADAALAAFDESLLTGEPMPVAKRAGEPVYAGSSCRERPALVRVARTGRDTRLSDLARLVASAQEARPRIAVVADALASRFVVGLLLLAAATAAGWAWFQPERAFEVTLAVLVISCPCALSLAIPAALSAAHAALARHGLLGLRADALDALAGADTIVLDKTGTLSIGRPRLAATSLLGALDAARAGAIAAALEAGSGHPLERAFAAPDAVPAADRRTHPGLGIEGVVDGRRWRLGRADFAAGEVDDGALWLGDGVRAEARFTIEDPLRPEAAAAIAALQAQGLAVELLSGDAPGPVAAAAVAMGGLPWRARQSPEDKLAHVRALQAAGHRVAMVGDGINDGPVLAGADVAIALAGGAPLAHRAADVVLLGDDLGRLADAVHLARRTRAVVRQNLAWASAYNLVAIPFAVAGVVTPWIAALGMAGSSLLVTLNALRLARSGGAERAA